MIRIEGLSLSYGTVRAVDGLDLHVQEGMLYGLLGPNGAGKTTTIACLAGLVRPDAGTIAVAGHDAIRSPRDVQRMLGVVPQELALYDELTVAANLRVFGGLAGLRGPRLADRLDWGLDLAQLAARADSRVAALSGGMKRRLNLAAALLHDPPVVVCDEPTTGVDAQSRRHIFDTIRGLHAAGRTVIYTTHYMEEVEALCHRVAIVDAGRVVAEDTVAALRSEGAGPHLHRVHLREGADADAVTNALTAAGLAVEAVEASPRSLEDVFLERTGHSLRDDT